MAAPLLDVSSIHVRYGQTLAVQGVDLVVEEREVVALLGRNGAGKTSVALAINGVVPLTAGRITFGGTRIDGMAAHLIARRGVLHVPEGRGVLREMTVRENLALGEIAGAGRASGVTIADVFEMFPRLKERLHQHAGSLSGGEQQMLVIGRALLGHPRLLILDEPSLGLAPQIVRQIFDMFGRFARSGLSVLLIEQNIALSLKIADRAYVLSDGVVALAGTAAALRDDPRIRSAYLGGDVAA